MIDRSLARDALGWGLGLWLLGYVLGIALFFVVPVPLIGWVLTPVATLVTILVVLTRVRTGSAARDAVVAVAWTAIAIAMDYVFMVVLLHPADGYYHADVLLYYALTLALPIAGGWWKRRRLEVPAR